MFSEIYFRKDVVPDMGAKMQEYSSSQEEIVTEGKTNTQVDEIKNLKLNQLVNFKDHPFKVETNTELFELMQSIEKDGVLVPLLARPNPNGEGYELISGHRRKAVCEWAGVTEVPVIVRDLDNCQAVIAMVHRQSILITCMSITKTATIYKQYYRRGAETMQKAFQELPNVGQMVDFDQAKDNIVMVLINTEQNKSMLESVPNRQFQDLSIIYRSLPLVYYLMKPYNK